MSEIKALDNLRKQLNVCKMHDMKPAIAYIADIADEIQAEIDERFMLLPVDADGVPIHVGDKMEYEYPNDDDKPFTILGVNNDGDVFHCPEDKRLVPTCISLANGLRHVKPRTLEDVLIDAMQFGFSSKAGENVSEKAHEFASEIRKLLKEGGE